MNRALILPEQTYTGTDRESFAKEYDFPMVVDGKTMNVNVQGSGENIVVLLAGRGVTAPAYDMAPLIKQLKDDCTVVTVDLFGSGLSDMTDKPRTSETIALEIHEALTKLGLSEYSLVAHSISGIYGLHYANLFPDEVKVFVGIDTAVPNMDALIRQYDPSLLAEEVPSGKSYSVDDDIGDVVGYEYSDVEKRIIADLHERNSGNDAVFQAIKESHGVDNKSHNDERFPGSIPVKFFLSSESVGLAPEWYKQEHEKQLTGVVGSSVEVLEGGHFLHHTQAAVIAKGVKSLKV